MHDERAAGQDMTVLLPCSVSQDSPTVFIIEMIERRNRNPLPV
jgi:hypothetical protein